MFRNKVTLGIAGTADSGGGLQPLIDIDSSFDFRSDPSFNDSLGGDFIIELKHAAEYVSLRYLARPSTVHAYGAGRPGRLWIGMTIPRGKRFANDVSPYTVLKDILETLRRNYMTARADGSFEFNPGSYPRAPFDDLLENRYPLEDFPGRYVEMCGERQGVVCPADDDAMTQFFADTQYAEFADFSSIMVSQNQSWSGGGIIKVEIPRPIHFDVFVSEKNYGVLTSPEQRFERILPSTDDVHDPLPVSFSLSELRKGACSSWARVDEAKEEIRLYPTFPDRSFRVDFEFRSSTGNLADVPCDPDRFYLSTYNKVMRKQFQREDGKSFIVFIGPEANERWEVRYDGGDSAELRFEMAVTELSPKGGKPVTVTLTPYADYQGIKFSGAQYLREDAFLEIAFSNKSSYKSPITKDSSISLQGRKPSDIQTVRLISDRYVYPELTRRYNPVSGWDMVMLADSPVLSEKGKALAGSGRLNVENRTVELTASLKAFFADGTTLEWGRIRLSRQESGEKGGFVLPSPYGQKGLKKVVLSELKQDRNNRNNKKKAFPDMTFVVSPVKGERPLIELDAQNGEYKIVIDHFDQLPFMERMKNWGFRVSDRIPWLALIAGVLLTLAAGVGACLVWQRYVSPWISTSHDVAEIGGGANDSSDEDFDNDSYYLASEDDNEIQDEDQPLPVVEVPSPAPQEEQAANNYRPKADDANKMNRYYLLMTDLKSADGQPLTFDQVREIQTWQKRMSREAGGNHVGDKFDFIKRWIDYFSKAVDEIEKIKAGEYRGKGLSEENYSKVLSDISRACDETELKPFRVAIQNLYITGQGDLTNEKKKDFIRRAVLSNAPRDKEILADVNSFRSISDKYNSQ